MCTDLAASIQRWASYLCLQLSPCPSSGVTRTGTCATRCSLSVRVISARCSIFAQRQYLSVCVYVCRMYRDRSRTVIPSFAADAFACMQLINRVFARVYLSVWKWKRTRHARLSMWILWIDRIGFYFYGFNFPCRIFREIIGNYSALPLIMEAMLVASTWLRPCPLLWYAIFGEGCHCHGRAM